MVSVTTGSGNFMISYLHFKQLWCSVMTFFCFKEKFLWSGVRPHLSVGRRQIFRIKTKWYKKRLRQISRKNTRKLHRWSWFIKSTCRKHRASRFFQWLNYIYRWICRIYAKWIQNNRKIMHIGKRDNSNNMHRFFRKSGKLRWKYILF